MPNQWPQRAACRGLGHRAAFATEWRKQRRFIAAHCDVCPVRQECLDEAMALESGVRSYERFGIRGGLTAAARVALGKQLAASRQPDTQPDTAA